MTARHSIAKIWRRFSRSAPTAYNLAPKDRKSVERLSVVDGAAVAVGWCEGNDPQIVIDEKTVPSQSCIRYKRPDVVAHHGRKFLNSGYRIAATIPADLRNNSRISVRFADGSVLRRTVAERNHVLEIRNQFAKEIASSGSASLLEIGSRARSGNTYKQLFDGVSTYVGVDVSPGPNVDIVADAHTLSKSITEQFDFAFSVSVFEHLIMPWVAAYEINKVLKPGGLVFTQSHPAWPLHEEPWDFFRFSKDAWAGIFNKYTGFELIDSGYGMEAAIVPMQANNGALQDLDLRRTFLLSACLARKVSDPLVDWSADPSIIYDIHYSH